MKKALTAVAVGLMVLLGAAGVAIASSDVAEARRNFAR